MKNNNMFRKFLALFLVGTMLAAVGCKDYDDDIDKLNGRLDGLEGTVALKTDLSAINASIAALEAIDHGAFLKTADLQGKLDAALAGYAKKTDLKAWLTSDEVKALLVKEGYKNEQQIKDLIAANSVNEAKVKEIFNTMIASTEAYEAFKSKVLGDITTELGKWSLNKTQLDQIQTALGTAIADENSAFAKSMNAWLGTEFAKYMAKYVKGNEFKSAASGAAIDAINAQIGDAQKTLKENIEKMIDEAIEKNNALYVKATDLNTKFGTYQETIEALAGRIAELQGRIQSLVWVPGSQFELIENRFVVDAAYYIRNGNSRYMLIEKNPRSLDLTFKVSPASLASKLTKETVRFDIEGLSWYPTRSGEEAAPALVIDEIEGDDVTGKIALKVHFENYIFEQNVGPQSVSKIAEEQPEALAFAMHVEIPAKAEGELGIDYTSNYVGTYPAFGGQINPYLVVANEDATHVYKGTSRFDTTMLYTTTATREFLKEFDVRFADYDHETDESTFVDPNEKWSNFPAIERVGPTKAAIVSGHEKNYTLTATTAAIKTSSTDLIHDEITSGEFAYIYAIGEKIFPIATLREHIHIKGFDTPVEATSTASAIWNYTTASAPADAYETNSVALTAGKLTAAIYKEMKTNLGFAAIFDAQGKRVEDPTFDAALSLTSTPTADTDIQLVKVRIRGELNADADYTLEATWTLANKNTVTITVPLHVVGMPKIADATITESITFDGARSYKLAGSKDYANLLWNEAWASTATPFFKDKKQFTDAVYAGTFKAVAKNKAILLNSAQSISITFNSDAAYGDYAPEATIEMSLGQGDAPLIGKIKTAVKFEDPAAGLTRVENFFDNDQALAQTTLVGDKFTIVDKTLDGAYQYMGTLKNTKIEYSLDNKQFGDFDGVKPVIANNKLVWNEWNKMTVMATVTLKAADGTALATEDFVVAIKDPVVAKATLKTDAKISLSKGSKTVDIASLITLKETVNGKVNIFDAAASKGLEANLMTAFASKVTYKIDEASVKPLPISAFTVDADGNFTTTLDPSLELLKDAVIKVNVEYTYQFGNRAIETQVTIIK